MKQGVFSERLIKALEYRGINRSQLAEKMGVRKSSVSDWANGKYDAGQDNLYIMSQVLNVSPAWLMGYGDEEEIKNRPLPSTASKGVVIKVLGTVPAGIPVEAIEEVIDYEEIDNRLAATGNFFGLRITGDSMSPRITEGDVVIVRKQNDVDSGDTAIVIVDGNDATCKKVIKNDAGIMLVPLNPNYEPTLYSPVEIEKIPVRIIGKVVELRGKF